ncbi:hypothetical protein ACFJIX_07995 [Roseateles sp. UC29_93]|uniref:hypothetical protein n=1 Tax=Roseateles sp. UC29_93 TaxID=3350177 RepID=UPI003673336A
MSRNSAATPFQLEASANAPCTSTMVGLSDRASVAKAGAAIAAAISAKAANGRMMKRVMRASA